VNKKEIADLNDDGEINDIHGDIGGIAAYLLGEYKDFSFGAEIISTVDHFRPGEMEYAYDQAGSARNSKPMSWNIEMAYRPL